MSEVRVKLSRRAQKQVYEVQRMRTSYHLYYSIREEGALVVIEAVWHAARGQGPDLS